MIKWINLVFNNSLRPPYWQKNAWNLNRSLTDGKGYENEGFIVWMRTAAMPTFKKLYAKSTTKFLQRGNYSLRIIYSWVFWFFSLVERKDPFVLVSFLFCSKRLSSSEFFWSKTIYNQYNVVDGRKKSFSRLGVHRCRNNFLFDVCHFFYSSSNVEIVSFHLVDSNIRFVLSVSSSIR